MRRICIEYRSQFLFINPIYIQTYLQTRGIFYPGYFEPYFLSYTGVQCFICSLSDHIFDANNLKSWRDDSICSHSKPCTLAAATRSKIQQVSIGMAPKKKGKKVVESSMTKAKTPVPIIYRMAVYIPHSASIGLDEQKEMPQFKEGAWSYPPLQVSLCSARSSTTIALSISHLLIYL